MKKILRKLIGYKRYIALHALFFGKPVVVGPFPYNEDGFATKDQSADFLENQKFIKAYSAGKLTGSWIRSSEIRWRVKVVLWAATHASHLDGDFVECGVNKGGYTRAILEYLPDFAASNRSFYLLDTFCGIPDSQITEEEKKHGRSSDCYDECYSNVVDTFKAYPFVKIIKGMIPETLEQVKSDRIAYISIDMNIVEPEIAAAEYFWPKLVPGGIMVLDDYNFTFHPAQRTAFNEFAARHNVEVLPLPTGQGLIIKN